jgi:very-short-patch-repair endonuclease
MSDAESSVFQSNLPLETKLERARMELLDLSARNRLLHIPRFSKSAKTIDVIDERSSEVFRLLVRESKAFTFVAGRADRAESGLEADLEDEEEISSVELAQPEEEEGDADARGIFLRHSDTKLQTRMTPKGLQKRLLDLYHDARTLEEEQGVNILFLALGTLNWIDPNKKENVRHAPLILIPVSLERGTAGEKFRLRLRPEDQTSNLSLEAYLDRVHALKLPSFEGGEEFDPAVYFSAVAEAISTKPDWAVVPDNIVLGFFSFAKFLMYRDLDPENWPATGRLTDQAMIRSLLSDGFEGREPLMSEDQSIDAHIDPEEMLHIVDSDSSQTLAVHDVRRGRDLVIQGPPGTGKSQTIANVIASAVADGKTVLFVAEKMAALDVVKRRLDQAGVGDTCLELHSNKANKRILLDELRRTWELGSPRGEFPSALTAKLKDARDLLNNHASRMHAPHAPSGLTAYEVIGHLTRLRQEGQSPVDLSLDCATSWTPDGFEARRHLLHELTQRIDEIGVPDSHPWNGVGLDMVLPTTVERLIPRLDRLRVSIENLRNEVADLSNVLELSPAPQTFEDVRRVREIAELVEAAPDFSEEALSSPIWDQDMSKIRGLVDQGRTFERALAELSPFLLEEALDTSIEGLAEGLSWLPINISSSAFTRARELTQVLPQLRADAERLRLELGSVGEIETFAAIAKLASTGERVAAAPDASPDAFAATVWDHGVEQAGDLAEAVASLEEARRLIGDRLLDVAWTTDVKAARQALATNTGLFRHFNSGWRKARALTRSIVSDQNAQIPEIIRLFDILVKGQVSASKIREGDAFGRSAFGADWRGERSASPPLQALVAWMRTLRGLGAEPRLIAGRLAQRAEVGDRSLHLRKLLDQAQSLLTGLWIDLANVASMAMNGSASVERASLELIELRARGMVWADQLSARLLKVVPEELDERLALIRSLSALQDLAKSIDDHEETGRLAFDGQWTGRTSNWALLSSGTDWIEQHGQLRKLAARLQKRAAIAASARHADREAATMSTELGEVIAVLQADPHVIFSTTSSISTSIDAAANKLVIWLANPEQLSKWVTYRERANKARAEGLAQIVDRLADGRMETGAARSTFEMAYYEAMLAELVQSNAEIGRFDGNLHGRQVQEFANLDLQRIRAASIEVVRTHHRKIPPRDGGVGPVGVLRAEMARRRGHMPIRQLMQKAGPAVQALKPVLMMSPLSVAQFLTPGRLTFDLLVMDEASQIQPVDALGAIARCRQVVVVGDERQLPPTKFFSKMTGSQAGEEDDDGTPVADIESILGLFVARGLPQRMLRWHYRSRHQSLIAISNSQFYENKLFIVPSPYTQEAGMGLRFQHVPEGVFDSGGTGTNAVEARLVAEAIIRHAKTNAELSLGVATFSVSQRRAIQDELEVLRRLNPDTEEFFHAHPSEPFFVKNLENVQGDERDVIMISVGYARNAQGYMAMRFGPLGADGGERRLNVLISRAKRRCEVFASMTDEDIDLSRAKGKGVFAFKLFLHYARTGRLSVAQSSGRKMDSVFEAQVANALQAKGYQVHPQVGIAGFFIDLAIADSQRPGRYLIGIECDGASYHSGRSARDRDRLRQAVLEDHGWIIHRIWSTDWFQRPIEQLERTIAAIEAAKIELDERLETGLLKQRAVPVEIVTVDRGDVTEIGLSDVEENGLSSGLYIEAAPARPGPYELHETPAGVMADLVGQVVRVEAPVHIDEVIARLRTAWGLQRAGARIEAAVEQGASLALARGLVTREGAFLSSPGIKPFPRDRGAALSLGLRKLEMIPPSEIAAGVLHVVSSNFGATDDEIVLTVSRMLGFRATSTQLRKGISTTIDSLLENFSLKREEKMITAMVGASTKDTSASARTN